MLVVCNGAFRCGSTWLFVLARCLVKRVETLPPEFALQGEWNGASIAAERLPEFLRSVDLRHRNFVIKSHCDGEETRESMRSSERTVSCRRV